MTAELQDAATAEAPDYWRRLSLARDVLELATLVFEQADEKGRPTVTLTRSFYKFAELLAGWSPRELRRIARAGLRLGVFSFEMDGEDPNAHPEIRLEGRPGEYSAEYLARLYPFTRRSTGRL